MNAHKRETTGMRQIDNLLEYVNNRMYRQEMGYSNGKYFFRGRWYSQEEVDSLFPVQLSYSVVQLDNRQIKS